MWTFLGGAFVGSIATLIAIACTNANRIEEEDDI